MIISKANSIRFIEIDGLDSNPNNTLFADESRRGWTQHPFYIKWDGAEKIPIPFQVRKTLTETLTFYKVLNGNTISTVTADRTETYDTFEIVDYSIASVTNECFYVLITSDEENSWQSEPIEIITRDKELKLQWYSDDPTTVFYHDYSNGQVNYMYLDGELQGYRPDGEDTTFDNQNEIIKVKSWQYRTFKLVTNPIPWYMAEKLQVALKHDNFIINDAQYVSKELIESEQVGKSNLYTISAVIIESAVQGLYPGGFDPDTIQNNMIENKLNESATVTGTFTASDGYNITQILAVRNSGSSADATIKVGTTIGGDEVLLETSVPAYGSAPLLENLRFPPPNVSGSWTIYYTIAGTTPDIYLAIQTINFNT